MRQFILLSNCDVIIIIFKNVLITSETLVEVLKINVRLPNTLGLPTRLKIDTMLPKTMVDQLVPPVIRFLAI